MSRTVDSVGASEISSRPNRAPRAGFRPDIEGLRALAVLLVIGNHAAVPFMTGGYVGVDVFFVISGFLITKHLVEEAERSGRIAYLSFYARRIRRLLPASTMVLLAVVLATLLWAPAATWGATSWEVLSAGLFVSNWVFAAKATDYFASEGPVSPVQHFWSLSVEEQFYFMWPALMGIFMALALLRSWHLRSRFAAGLTLVFVPSLGYSILLTSSNPDAAYFVTTTRLWELALGGLVAIAWPLFGRIGRHSAFLAGWAGIALIMFSALTFTEETRFPGAAALLPTLGAAGVIIAGASEPGRATASRLLGVAPMVWIGALSYSLYLWHWPFINFAPDVFPDRGAWLLIVAAALSLIPAWLSFKFVEQPVRRSPRLRASNSQTVTLAVICLGLVLGASALLQLRAVHGESESRIEVASVDSTSHPGAAALFENQVPVNNIETIADIVPNPDWVPDDKGRGATEPCRASLGESTVHRCDAGDPDHPTRVVMVGDSHTWQWFPALEIMAENGDFYLQQMGKGSCPLADTPIKEPACLEWQQAVVRDLQQNPPDVLLVSANDNTRALAPDGGSVPPEESAEQISAGMARTYHDLIGRGVRVVYVVDTPSMQALGVFPPKCVSQHIDDLEACTLDASEVRPGGISRVLRGVAPPGVHFVDMKDGFCRDGRCQSVVGNVIVYRDKGHVSASYIRTLSPYLRERLQDVL